MALSYLQRRSKLSVIGRYLINNYCIFGFFYSSLVRVPVLQFNVIYSWSLNSLLTLFISVSGNCGQHNRRITFLTPVRGFYLEGHVISNHSVELNLGCQDQCALARECVSYNIGPTINNKFTCELSNSDHLQHPEDLKPRKDWIYRGTQVLVGRKMAQPNFKNSLSLCSNDLLEFYFKTVSVKVNGSTGDACNISWFTLAVIPMSKCLLTTGKQLFWCPIFPK